MFQKINMSKSVFFCSFLIRLWVQEKAWPGGEQTDTPTVQWTSEPSCPSLTSKIWWSALIGSCPNRLTHWLADGLDPPWCRLSCFDIQREEGVWENCSAGKTKPWWYRFMFHYAYDDTEILPDSKMSHASQISIHTRAKTVQRMANYRKICLQNMLEHRILFLFSIHTHPYWQKAVTTHLHLAIIYRWSSLG